MAHRLLDSGWRLQTSGQVGRSGRRRRLVEEKSAPDNRGNNERAKEEKREKQFLFCSCVVRAELEVYSPPLVRGHTRLERHSKQLNLT